MAAFELFDTVKLNEDVALTEGEVAPAGTLGVIVEVLGAEEAILVELFGAWVELDDEGTVVRSDEKSPTAFVETIGVAMAQPEQLTLVKAAAETMGARGRLLTLLEELPEAFVQEILDRHPLVQLLTEAKGDEIELDALRDRLTKISGTMAETVKEGRDERG